MKLSLKLLFSALLFLTFSSHALEEPPGSESIADGDRYVEQLAKDRAAGKIHMDKGIEKSWEQSIVFIPGSSRQRSIMGLQLDKKYPTVIYLHGCGGISRWNDNRWGQFISELGFVAILPDSLARPGRVSNCDPSTQLPTFRFPMAEPYRQQEIAYAMNELKKLQWVDTKNIYFMGHSEGANALAKTKITGSQGIILSSGFCFTGISFEQGVPGLVITFSDDPWHRGAKSRCAEGRSDGSLTAINLLDSGHDTFDQSEVRQGVAKFLRELCGLKPH